MQNDSSPTQTLVEHEPEPISAARRYELAARRSEAAVAERMRERGDPE